MEMAMGLEDDLTQLDDLTEEAILERLKNRYERDLIYTKVSDILIALNPCKDLKIYETTDHDSHRWDSFDETAKPHIFGVATAAYRRMRDSQLDQVIIVSGESGAGKTESAKQMVKHMVHMCQQGDMELHDKIIKVNPLLEAFGNAKTVMNWNSSRYAKFLEIHFQENGQLQGAVVRDYMLEKARVCYQAPGEGIFHIFYAMFAGTSKEQLKNLSLTEKAGEYRIMRSDPASLDMEDDYRKQFDDIMQTLKQINVDSNVMLAMLAAVVHITDITFSESDRGVAEIDDAAPYVYAAELLDLNENDFAEALVTRKVLTLGQEIVTYKSVKQAEDSRDALAKMLYERIFGWLVRSINQDLHPSRKRTGHEAKIGILDIAGFEKLKKNSFEQLCINVVNEKLQNHTNERLFKTELEIYQSEGIAMEGIHFQNNQETLDLFIKPRVGLLAILDEQTKFQQSSDESFVQLLDKQLKSNKELYSKPRGDLPTFAIKHFAGLVVYDAVGFIEKNRDTLNPELLEVMKGSKDEFISDLFRVKRSVTGTISTTFREWRASRISKRGGVRVFPKHETKKGKQLATELGQTLTQRYGEIGMPSNNSGPPSRQHASTLAGYFQKSLMELVSKLREAEPFFVRCLKPNPMLNPNQFMSDVVGDQLRYNGIAAVATIRRMGFSVRKKYADFNPMFSFILKDNKDKALPAQEVAKKILLSTPPDFHRDFRCGKTKVFMKESVELWLKRSKQLNEKQASRVLVRAGRDFVEKVRERKRREEEERRKRAEEQRRQEEEDRKKKEAEEKARIGTSLCTSKSGVGWEGIGGEEGGGGTSESPTESMASSQGSRSDDYPDIPDSDPSPEASPILRPPSPPIPHVLPTDAADKANKAKKTKEDKPIAFWDIPQIIHREKKKKDVHEERSLQVIKVITYFILFCILLFCAVGQKLSLMILVSPQFVEDNRTPFNNATNDTIKMIESNKEYARYMLLLIAILIPYGLILLTSIFKWMFGSMPNPKATTIFFTTLTETLHTVGLCLLCFKVLPNMDMVGGIMILSGVAILPSVLKPLCTSEAFRRKQKNRRKCWKVLEFALDSLAVIVQFLAIVIALATAAKYRISDNGRGEGDIYDDDTKNTINMVETAFALFLVSISWWENFIDDRFCGELGPNNWWLGMILKIKFDLQECRPVVSSLTSVWKIGLTILIAYILNNEAFENITPAFDTLDGDYLINNSAILTLTLAGYVGNYVAYTACKLQLQYFSFVLPLVLSTPLAVLVAILDCHGDYNILGPFTSEQRSCMNVWINNGSEEEAGDWWIPFKNEPSRYWQLFFGFAWFLSLYWVGRHIFFPRQERLAKAERMFLNPFYCGILFEQHLVLNRRRHNRKVKRDIKEDKIVYKLSRFDTQMNVEGLEIETKDESSDGTNLYNDSKFSDVPMIYACATMWHENRTEMTQLMKSIFRMDRDQCIRKTAEVVTGKRDPDFYDFEAHILFDDAMEQNDDGEWIPNKFVKLTLEVMEEAASSVHERKIVIKPPIKIPSPYGGQLVWEMPGSNFLFLHMKDKQKIRHRKRWSQVMYMYYLLGYRIIRHCQETVTAALESNRLNELSSWRREGSGNVGKSHIFETFDEEVQRKAANTFILALDGDVDFTPGAVRLLLDKMHKNEKVGAACGRIHPIGSGPVVWFQKFEYATAHWLQKATEHVLGCVLCSPGCFSLFRGSALMDDNVMKKYTIRPTEATHHLMYDQGEDRWLCTLLLQQGYRVDYVAASDAYTYAPEGFAEFFNQRRRWMPSTVANIADLLADYRNTVYVNSNISMLYIVYQFSLLLSTVVGPATVLMMIASAALIVFQVNLFEGYLIALLPAIFYFIVCMTMKVKWQLMLAEVLSGVYAFIMMIVLVGTIVTAVQESPFHPSVLFIVILVLIFALAAALHPREWSCAVFGVLYYLMVPTGFLILIIYSICNLHVVSWGTREVPKKKTKQEEEEEKRIQEEKERKKKEQGFFGRFFPQSPIKELKDIISKITDLQGPKQATVDSNTRLLEQINEGINTLVRQQAGEQAPTVHAPTPVSVPDIRIEIEPPLEEDTNEPKIKGILKGTKMRTSTSFSPTVLTKTGTGEEKEEPIYDRVTPMKRDELKNPFWSEDKDLGNGEILLMVEQEKEFWRNFIDKYLAPLDMSEHEKKTTAKGLIKLRNDVALGFVMINLLWIAINFMFQLSSPTKVQIPFAAPASDDFTEEDQETVDNPLIQVDILGLLFIFFFAIVLVIQFVGMIMHRWGTFLHLVSITELRNPLKEVKEEELSTREAIEIVEQVLDEPVPDYPVDSDEEDDETERAQTEELKEDLQRLMATGTRTGIRMNPNGNGVLGTSTRQLGVSRRSSHPLNLSRIGNTLVTSLRVTSRFDAAPDREDLRWKLQDGMRKAKDPKYKDRELPPIKEKGRLNTTAGHLELKKLIKNRNLHVTFQDPASLHRDGRPFIRENDDDYDFIPGTLGRELGKKFKLLSKQVADSNPRPNSTSALY